MPKRNKKEREPGTGLLRVPLEEKKEAEEGSTGRRENTGNDVGRGGRQLVPRQEPRQLVPKGLWGERPRREEREKEGLEHRDAIDYKRQILLFNPEEYQAYVSIVGLGNIGSHTALTLCRLGITSFQIWDDDLVENHNLTSQAYDVNDLGKSKAEALASKMKAINPDVNVLPLREKYVGQPITGIVIIAVDTMVGRKIICESLQKLAVQPQLIIDARVGGGQLEIYVCKNWAEWLETFVDKPSQDPCGGRFICYTSVVTGALITNVVKKYLKGDPYDKSTMMHIDTLQVIKNFKF